MNKKFDDFIKEATEGAISLEKIAELREKKDQELLEKLAAFTQQVIEDTIVKTAAVTAEYILEKLAEESAEAGTSAISDIAGSSPEAESASAAPITVQEIKETTKAVAKDPNTDTVQGAAVVVAKALESSPEPHAVADEVVNAVHEALDETAAKGEVHPDEAEAAKQVATETAAKIVASS